MILNMKKITKILLCLCLVQIIVYTNAYSQATPIGEDWQATHTLQQLQAVPVALIPFPQQVSWTQGQYLLRFNTTIGYTGNNMPAIAGILRFLQDILADHKIVARQLPFTNTAQILSGSDILLRVDTTLAIKQEGYALKVSGKQITITGKDAAGLYYGVQTFRQLIVKKGNRYSLPFCSITDWPAFQLRGFMHDNGRNFQEIVSLKQQIDRLSMYKFNTFHWHFTDNPAWRPQSILYPQLNDAKNRKPGRDPGKSYSFNEIRELIAYARERFVTVIPELDMPGHSAYFKTSFGFTMESEQGMQVLEKLIDEFCTAIPVADCPVLHIGSDEIHIANPTAFIRRMTARVKANGRKVMVWNPGLPPEPGTIEQVWRDGVTSGMPVSGGNPYVDSYAGYLNSYDALSLVQRYFFQQVCNRPNGDATALGGILCCWPDTRVDDKTKIFLYNPVWPGALAYSEAIWCGRPQRYEKYMSALPPVSSLAGSYFHEFEKRLADHRDRFFKNEAFPYLRFGNMEWQLTGPYFRNATQPADQSFAPEKTISGAGAGAVVTQKVTGGVVRMEGWLDPAIIAAGSANETVYLTAYIHCDKTRTIHAMTGFEAPVRSNRRSAGIPANGKWDANGGAIFINDKELQGPAWQNPGGNRYLKPTWETPANEIPYTDEEFYWARPPASIVLQKGRNKILVRMPCTYKDQAWMFAFVPVTRNEEGRWVDDLSVRLELQ